jgi:hypothetical protein
MVQTMKLAAGAVVTAADSLLNAEVRISDKTVIGVPFGKSFWKRTPKFWRIVGDSVSGAGTAMGVIGGITKNPVVVIVSVSLGWVGKLITNCTSAAE